MMKLKKGDNVKVLSGKDKNKTGRIIQMLFDKASGRRYVVVESVNMMKKHLRSRSKEAKGQTIELAAPIDASNVQLIDPSSKKPTRVGVQGTGSDKQRVAKRSGSVIS